MKENTTTIGTYLRNLRCQHKYTQAHVASHLNIIRQTYSHYETGRIYPPTDVLIALTHLYHVPIESFFEPELHNVRIKEASANQPSHEAVLSRFDATTLLFDRQTITKESELLSLFRVIEERDQDDIMVFLKAKAGQYRNVHHYSM